MTKVNVDFSRDEFDKVAARAEARGFGVSTFIKDAALRHAWAPEVTWSDNVAMGALRVT